MELTTGAKWAVNTGKTSKEGFIISALADPENKYTDAKPTNLLYTEIQLQSEQI
jgi:hypothetical protein